jgi:hypothetical protein
LPKWVCENVSAADRRRTRRRVRERSPPVAWWSKKPSEIAPLSAIIFSEILHKAGVPKVSSTL